MCAKVAQFLETKEQKVKKKLKSFVISHFLCTFASDNKPLKQAGGSLLSVLPIHILRKNAES